MGHLPQDSQTCHRHNAPLRAQRGTPAPVPHARARTMRHAGGRGRPSTFFDQRLAVVLWSACFLAHAGTAAADGAPDSEMLGVQLLIPRPNTMPDFCVDHHGNVEVDVRLLVSDFAPSRCSHR